MRASFLQSIADSTWRRLAPSLDRSGLDRLPTARAPKDRHVFIPLDAQNLEKRELGVTQIPFSELAPLSGHEAVERLESTPTSKIANLHFLDLLPGRNDAFRGGRGVYLFFSPNGDCVYVGKNSSQTFVERIPWHFSIWERSWGNHLVKRIRARSDEWAPGGEDIDTLYDAAQIAVEFRVLLIPFDPPQTDRINAFERFLRTFLEPEFNSFKSDFSAEYDLTDDVGKILATS